MAVPFIPIQATGTTEPIIQSLQHITEGKDDDAGWQEMSIGKRLAPVIAWMGHSSCCMQLGLHICKIMLQNSVADDLQNECISKFSNNQVPHSYASVSHVLGVPTTFSFNYYQ